MFLNFLKQLFCIAFFRTKIACCFVDFKLNFVSAVSAIFCKKQNNFSESSYKVLLISS